MGYASGGAIFDRTAHALVASGADDRIITEVCAALAEALTDMDWDTLDESVDEFLGQPAVLAGLRQGAPHWFEDDDIEPGDE